MAMYMSNAIDIHCFKKFYSRLHAYECVAEFSEEKLHYSIVIYEIYETFLLLKFLRIQSTPMQNAEWNHINTGSKIIYRKEILKL